jgi:hypothetical protein
MIEIVLASIAAGMIATVAMVAVTYLPLAWGGVPCDVIGMLGSFLVGDEGRRGRYLGGVAFTAGGVLFAVLYGMLIAQFMAAGAVVPRLTLDVALPTRIDLFYPLTGVAMGFVHGGVVTLLMTIVVTEHHPLDRHRGGVDFVVPLMAGHLAFGATAGFFLHQLLQLLAG